MSFEFIQWVCYPYGLPFLPSFLVFQLEHGAYVYVSMFMCVSMCQRGCAVSSLFPKF